MLLFNQEKIDLYKSGELLYGNDLNLQEIEQWYSYESHAYADICPEEHFENFDEYKEMAILHNYDYLPKDQMFQKVMLYGGGTGTEIIPIARRVKDITVLDPGEKFNRPKIVFQDRDGCGEKHIVYVKPAIDGNMIFQDNTFQLVTCFGVLHHVPNVEYILKELYRVTDKGGYLLIREPCTSMNIFTRETRRPDVTDNERGIPVPIMRRYILDAGFSIEKETIFEFRPFNMFKKLKRRRFFLRFDRSICRIFSFNKQYDAANFLAKFQAGGVAYVLKK